MNNKQTVPTDQRNKWGDDNINNIIMDIFKAGVEWQKEQSEKQWTDKDMESAWKSAYETLKKEGKI